MSFVILSPQWETCFHWVNEETLQVKSTSRESFHQISSSQGEMKILREQEYLMIDIYRCQIGAGYIVTRLQKTTGLTNRQTTIPNSQPIWLPHHRWVRETLQPPKAISSYPSLMVLIWGNHLVALVMELNNSGPPRITVPWRMYTNSKLKWVHSNSLNLSNILNQWDQAISTSFRICHQVNTILRCSPIRWQHLVKLITITSSTIMKTLSGSSNNGVGSNIYHLDFEDDTHSSIKHSNI